MHLMGTSCKRSACLTPYLLAAFVILETQYNYIIYKCILIVYMPQIQFNYLSSEAEDSFMRSRSSVPMEQKKSSSFIVLKFGLSLLELSHATLEVHFIRYESSSRVCLGVLWPGLSLCCQWAAVALSRRHLLTLHIHYNAGCLYQAERLKKLRSPRHVSEYQLNVHLYYKLKIIS